VGLIRELENQRDATAEKRTNRPSDKSVVSRLRGVKQGVGNDSRDPRGEGRDNPQKREETTPGVAGRVGWSKKKYRKGGGVSYKKN